MILDLYKDSFEYSGQDIKVLLKLGILSFLSFFILPAFLLSGYQYRVIETGINGMIGGEDKLPSFDNITGMFVDGIKYFLVQLIYVLVPLIVFFVLETAAQSINSPALSGVAMILGVVLLILAEFYVFMAIPNMIANGSFKAAFDIKKLNEVIKTIGVGRYVVFYIGLILLVFVISIVVGILLMLVLGLFGFAVSFVDPYASAGIFLSSMLIFSAIFSFIVGPYLMLFTGRATGLIYAVGE